MKIDAIVNGMPTSDGDGVRLTRMIGTPELEAIDPFLMLDRFDSDDPDAYIGGFPDHPHRGFETVTLMLDGQLRHRDSTGGEGLIGPGDVQWMTAGRGIVHSEMPQQIDGRMRGFQLWVNLPAADKMRPAGYQDITASTIPVLRDGGVSAHVVAGRWGDVDGPARTATPIRLVRMDAAPGAVIGLEAAPDHNAFACVYDGAVSAPDGTAITAPSLAVLSGGGDLTLTAGAGGASLLYADGQPIGEPVARLGPFVMNTEAELRQAVMDFRAGRLG